MFVTVVCIALFITSSVTQNIHDAIRNCRISCLLPDPPSSCYCDDYLPRGRPDSRREDYDDDDDDDYYDEDYGDVGHNAASASIGHSGAQIFVKSGKKSINVSTRNGDTAGHSFLMASTSYQRNLPKRPRRLYKPKQAKSGSDQLDFFQRPKGPRRVYGPRNNSDVQLPTPGKGEEVDKAAADAAAEAAKKKQAEESQKMAQELTAKALAQGEKIRNDILNRHKEMMKEIMGSIYRSRRSPLRRKYIALED